MIITNAPKPHEGNISFAWNTELPSQMVFNYTGIPVNDTYHFLYVNLYIFLFDKGVELVGGGFVINKTALSSF